MKIKTQDLQGEALDWAAALAAGYDEGWLHRQLQRSNPATSAIPRLGSDWAEAGPIIEKLDINIQRRTHAETTERGQEIYRKDGWTASTTPTAYWMTPVRAFGATPLEAAMRCFVAKEIGKEVEVPDVLCAQVSSDISTTYDITRIAWELNQTALGNAHYGNALRVAKEMPGVTSEDRSLLDRFATGTHSGTDHVALQDLVLRINQSNDVLDDDDDEEPEGQWLTGCPECGMDGGCDCPSGTWNPPKNNGPDRAPLLWVLWHHQGGSSPIGQPIRAALGMGQHDRLSEEDVALAKAWAEKTGWTIEHFHKAKSPQIDWSQAGPLMEAAASANVAGHTAGTTNWAAHVYNHMASKGAMIDRSDAVNLARNLMDPRIQSAITAKGIIVLRDAVLAMDAKLNQISHQSKTMVADADYEDRLTAAQRHGLVPALREAAAILAEIKPGTEPANMRWPLADELEGLAHMLDDSTQDQSDAEGETIRPTGG